MRYRSRRPRSILGLAVYLLALTWRRWLPVAIAGAAVAGAVASSSGGGGDGVRARSGSETWPSAAADRWSFGVLFRHYDGDERGRMRTYDRDGNAASTIDAPAGWQPDDRLVWDGLQYVHVRADNGALSLVPASGGDAQHVDQPRVEQLCRGSAFTSTGATVAYVGRRPDHRMLVAVDIRGVSRRTIVRELADLDYGPCAIGDDGGAGVALYGRPDGRLMLASLAPGGETVALDLPEGRKARAVGCDGDRCAVVTGADHAIHLDVVRRDGTPVAYHVLEGIDGMVVDVDRWPGGGLAVAHPVFLYKYVYAAVDRIDAGGDLDEVWRGHDMPAMVDPGVDLVRGGDTLAVAWSSVFEVGDATRVALDVVARHR